ncbi:WW domain-binding protein 2 isoform X2 [Parasteatoda tepidariorum]|uniref:WW domain-binding protein 2 isoform X2 n=1 Tax=Parasteatoda tepidariorum TaxID=114398 RepID=UPI001C723CE3|nr:WW domain-binding protein 2 isoform X2 [Parasteatoda tepidariorum]
MSLNTAHANGGVLIYNGEIILLYCDGVEFIIEGNDVKQFGGTKKGRMYLTTHRIIFMNKSEKDALQSFSFPFFSLSGVELEQPLFGANYIKGAVTAQAGGNWTGRATFKLKFFSGGAIEFGQAMVKAAKMASQYMPPQPPAYTPHQGPYFPAPPPAYMPPEGGVNGFIPPTDVFPNAPPANSVYTMDMPPPYPGIYPPPYAYAPGSGMYPQAASTGLFNHPGAPPPPGFNSDGGATAPPPYGHYQGSTSDQAPPLARTTASLRV